MLCGDHADLAGAASGHQQFLRGAGGDDDVRPGQQRSQLHRLGGGDLHSAAPGLPGEVVDRGVREQPAPADDHQVVGDQRGLAHQVRGEHHGPALVGQAAQQVAYPQHSLRVEAVDGFVEHDHGRVAEQGGGDAEALAHAEGEGADALSGHAGQSGQLDDLVDPAARDAMGVGQGHEVADGRAARVDRLGLQQGADLLERCGVLRVAAAVDGGRAAGRRVQADDHAHGRGFSGAVGAEESGDLTRLDGEAQSVDGCLVPVPLGQVAYFDHRASSFASHRHGGPVTSLPAHARGAIVPVSGPAEVTSCRHWYRGTNGGSALRMTSPGRARRPGRTEPADLRGILSSVSAA